MTTATLSTNPRAATGSLASPSARLTLPEGHAHVWVARTAQCHGASLVAEYRSLLSADEHRRMNAFRFPHLQHQYLVTRALCRTTLSRYADVAPRDWQFGANAYGRPELAATHAACGLRFNLSNVPDVVACVVTRGCDVGVDVEPITRMQGEHSIADRYFTADESADIRAAAPERRSERFFRYWTLKEAYIKAHGSGLSLPLDAFAMRLGGERIGIAFDARIDDRADDWQFAQEWIDDVHLLAVAVRQAGQVPLKLSVFSVVPGQK